MGLRVAVASGNWSNPATWNAGVIPVVGDTIASNTYTVTIDQDINVALLTNTVQASVSAVPVMTSATTPSGIVTASTEYDSSRLAWTAFNPNNPLGGNGWISANNTAMPQWIGYEFTSAKLITSYSWNAFWNLASAAKDFQFQAWDGTNWIALHTVTNSATQNYTSPVLTHTTSYTRYRFYITATNGGGTQFVSMGTIKMFESSDFSGTVNAGGTFILNSGVTVTCTSTTGILAGPSDCLTFSGSGTSTINSNISPTTSNVNATTLVHSGTGTLNLVGNVFGHGVSHGTRIQTMLFSGSGVFNITGDITGLQTKTGFTISGAGTCNIIGNLYPGNAGIAITVSGNATVNITGTIFPLAGGSTFTAVLWVSAVSAVVTVTGNVFLSTTTTSMSPGIVLTTSRLNVIGNVYGNTSGYNTITSGSSNGYVTITGSIIAVRGIPTFNSTSINAINILTGPFICSDTGIQPIFVARMHYKVTSQSYYEFRDNSTNGANPPAAQAPATRLVSPDTIIGSLLSSNVRQGVVYALGSQTGTMVVPSPSNVTINVPVDNTVGTAILNADNLWAIDTSTMNTANSIGERLKNAATVQTVGDQLVSLL